MNFWIQYVVFSFLFNFVIVAFQSIFDFIIFIFRHLYEDIMRPSRNASFVFLDPNTTATVGTYRQWIEEDVKERLIVNAGENTLFLAPMNVG